MLDALDITEEEALGLAEVARHDLAMVRSFAAQDLDEHVVALSHTLDLPLAKARLWRDLPDPEAPAEPAQPDPGPDVEPGWRGAG